MTPGTSDRTDDIQELALYQVDAFAAAVFAGNPAAVVPLQAWLDDEVLQAIAEENHLSETAFFVPDGETFALRWFTPVEEVDLCGHATLACAHVLYTHLGFSKPAVCFQSRSGPLSVKRTGDGYRMDFPAEPVEAVAPPEPLVAGLGVAPKSVLAGSDYLAVYDSEQTIRSLAPDFPQLRTLGLRGVVATAPGDDCDFVSRCFYPRLGIEEDPVTGSAHCAMAPYWAERLGRTRLQARQLSRRGGVVDCEVHGGRVLLTGSAEDYMVGTIRLPNRHHEGGMS